MDPKTAVDLVSAAGSVPAIGSDFGMRLNTLGLNPVNGPAAGVVAGLVVSSAAGFVSSFTTAAPSEKPLKLSVGTGATGTVAGAVADEDELIFPFVPINNGGVFGRVIAGGVVLAGWSANGSAAGCGGAGFSAGDGDVAPTSHWPNGILGDAGCGLSEAGFSPLTSSSSPPDTGTFARGELRSGRVLGLPKPIAGVGDGESEGDGSVGVGCWRGVCSDSGGEGSVDGDSGGVVLRTRSDRGAFDGGSDIGFGCTLIEGLSAFGVLEGERDAGSGTVVGSASSLGGTPPSSWSPSSPSLSSSFSSSPSSSSTSPSPSGSPSEYVSERNSSICSSPRSLLSPSEEGAVSSSSSPRETSTNDSVDDRLLKELAADTV